MEASAALIYFRRYPQREDLAVVPVLSDIDLAITASAVLPPFGDLLTYLVPAAMMLDRPSGLRSRPAMAALMVLAAFVTYYAILRLL